MDYTKKIEEYKLRPSVSRKMPLFTACCVVRGYSIILKELIGVCYNPMWILSKGAWWTSILNDDDISRQIGEFLDNNQDREVLSLFESARKLHKICRREFESLSGKDPVDSVRNICSFYPSYFGALCVYNSMGRYLGSEEEKGRLTRTDTKVLAKERTVIGGFYEGVEKELKRCADSIGNRIGVDGKLLLYLTPYEMKTFLKKGRLEKNLLSELKKRKEEFLLMKEDGEQMVLTDHGLILSIRSKFDMIAKVDSVNGQGTYKGIVRGRVYNLLTHEHKKISDDGIIITAMTVGKDVPLIARCAAMVTDEGGALSHAAIFAREFRKPCVMGTKNATKVFKDGDFVEVNGEKGVVRRINEVS